MKKVISMVLAAIILFSVCNINAFAAKVTTPKTSASNDIGCVKVSWDAIDGAVKYNVYRRVGGTSTWVLVAKTLGTRFTDYNVSNGKYYAYSVRAYKKQGDYSAYDKNMTYVVKCVETPWLKSLIEASNGFQLTWNGVSGASYRVYRKYTGAANWLYIGTTDSTTFTDTQTTSGRYCYYTVRAVSSGYYSGFDKTGFSIGSYSSYMCWPLPYDDVYVSTLFKWRWGKQHNGIDTCRWSGTDGADVVAVKDGTIDVALCGYNGGYGNYVVVNHGEGVLTYYAHLSNSTVSVGQSVQQGQVIGQAGNTGQSYGAHLHFGIMINGSWVNPLNYLDGGSTIQCTDSL